jgi:hypothetical protein
MGKVSVIDPLTDPRWDRFVENHPFGWICQLSGWKRVLEGCFRHMKGCYFALWDESGKQIQAGLPVFHVRSWITGSRLVSIPFATLCDPLVSSADQFSQLFSSVKESSSAMKAEPIEVRTHLAGPLIKNQGLAESLSYAIHSLDLSAPPELIKKKFKRLCVRNIERSMAEGFRLGEVKDESGLKAFYRLHMAHRSKIGLPVHPYRFFEQLWQVFAPNRMKILLCSKNHYTVGGLLVFCHGGRISCDYLATAPEHQRSSPGSFLYWEAIKMGCREGFRVFDFGRTHCGHRSLVEFKGRWGTRAAGLPQFIYPKEKAAAFGSADKSLKRRLVMSACKRAPAFAQRMIGELVYRHLG